VALDGRDLASPHRTGDAVAPAAGQDRTGQVASLRGQGARLLPGAGTARFRDRLLVLAALLAGTHDVRLHPGAQLGSKHSAILSLNQSGRMVVAEREEVIKLSGCNSAATMEMEPSGLQGPLCADKEIHLWGHKSRTAFQQGHIFNSLCGGWQGLCWHFMRNYLIRKCGRQRRPHNILCASFYCGAHTHSCSR